MATDDYHLDKLPNPNISGKMSINVIVAVSGEDGIGMNGKIPWINKEDMHHFRKTTMGHFVLMGRKTWESIPSRFRPLAGRINIVISSQDIGNGAITVADLEEGILRYEKHKKEGEDLFICGGEQVYRDFIELFPHRLNKLYITRIEPSYVCDKHFPTKAYLEVATSNGLGERKIPCADPTISISVYE